MAKAKVETSTVISLSRINLKKLVVTVKGTSSLIVHKWSEKAKKQILSPGKIRNKAPEPRDPVRDFIDSAYWLSHEPKEKTEVGFEKAINAGATFGFPSIAFKKAVASAAYRNKLSKDKVSLMGAFYVDGELVEIKSDTPIMREDMVILKNGSADIRFRPEFKNWTAELNITYNADFFTPTVLVNLINLSGFSVGVGEWRPEKGGSFGMFEVV